MSFGLNTIELAIGGATAIPLNADSVTDGQVFLKSYEWSLSHSSTGVVGGTPKFIIEGSNDNLAFEPVASDENGDPLEIEFTANNSPIINDIFPFKYFRIRIVQGATTAGVGTFILTIVQDS